MNGNRKLKLMVAALLGASVASAPAVVAQELPDFDQWQCRFCPFPEKGVEGHVDASVLHVSEDSARFGDYTGLDEKGAYVNVDADILYRGEGGYAVSLEAFDLGLDSRRIDISAGRQGRWVADIYWDEIPRRLDDSVQTVFGGLGSDTLTRPDGWVRSGLTSGMTALDDNLRDFTLGWDRKTLGLGFEFVQSKRIRYEVDYSRQTKQGRGLAWGSFLGASHDLVKPLDYQTDQVDAAIVFSGSNWNIRTAYYGSFFKNNDPSLTWDNLFTGPDQGRSALAPDNHYHQAIISGGYRFSRWDSALNASYAVGRMEQDDGLLAYTINPAIAAQPLPIQNYDGRADTTHANLRFTARPVQRLRLTTEYRFSERDNRSGQYEWAAVQADSFPTVPFVNPAYGFESRDLSLTADYRFSRAFQGAAGWQDKVRKRDFQSVDRTDEEILWARVRFRPISELTLGLRVESASRDASEHRVIPSTGAGAEQNPLLRKYYIADRDRNTAQFQADFVPAGRLSLSARYERAKDRYNESQVGLVASDYDQLSGEATLRIGERLVATAYYSRENYDSEMVGAASFATPNIAPPNWAGRTADQHDVHGLALRWSGLLEGKLDLSADWNQADTTGDIDIENPLGGTVRPFPTLRSKLTGAQLMADWHLNPRWSINAGWRWEKFSADDWAKDGVGPATIDNVLTFGAQTLDYDVNVFLVGFRYRFVRSEEE